ncbi:hypothetical protein BDV96DRAFT_137041 [Lophiotrema nucula]|uniref:Uncharacterized protein n=1 Tax=Lophiotrema nucula TaxID=690887 RepID=A0A6A5ZV30_9PLEO|nr:hypothetical protein BDV96DRAFT_137041 [Lophiotrema nucula]
MQRVLMQDDFLQNTDFCKVSNICDRGYVGPDTTLAIFAPILKSKVENPKAALIMLFLNAVMEELHYNDGQYSSNNVNSSMDITRKFMTKDSPNRHMYFMRSANNLSANPEIARFVQIKTMLGDFEAGFASFLAEVGMDMLAASHGTIVKKTHSIVEPWPYRITAHSTQQQFEERLAGSLTGQERYMEFEKTG